MNENAAPPKAPSHRPLHCKHSDDDRGRKENRWNKIYVYRRFCERNEQASEKMRQKQKSFVRSSTNTSWRKLSIGPTRWLVLLIGVGLRVCRWSVHTTVTSAGVCWCCCCYSHSTDVALPLRLFRGWWKKNISHRKHFFFINEKQKETRIKLSFRGSRRVKKLLN